MSTLTLVLGMAGLALALIGGGWDVAWHRTIGRDTFWSSPHVLIYGGIALSGLAALAATVRAVARGGDGRRELRIGPLRCEPGLALVGIGATGVIASGPFDDAWHSIFGRDVDIWSPPHLTAVAFSAVIYAGWSIALAAEGAGRVLRIAVLAGLCGVAVFALNFYYMIASTREAFFYPLLATISMLLVLGFASRLLDGEWSATLVTAAYTGVALVTFGVLRSRGFDPPAFPPLVLAGAVALDLARRRTAHPLLLGAAFAVAFVAAEAIRMAFVAPGPPLPATTPSDHGEALFLQYRAQAIARPWLSAWPLAAAIAATAFGGPAWTAGRHVAASLLALGDAQQQPLRQLERAPLLQPRDP